MAYPTVRCIIVGEPNVGKTNLQLRYCSNDFPEYKLPFICGPLAWDITVKDKKFHISVSEADGKHDSDRIRPISYIGADVVLLCFSVVHPETYSELYTRWHPELQHHCPTTPVILVGTKTDLLEDEQTLHRLLEQHQASVSFKQGEAMAARIGAAKYLECSAWTGDGVEDVFIEALKSGSEPRIQPKGSKKTKSKAAESPDKRASWFNWKINLFAT
ncbi:hypothetical protein DL96DRAFT_106148 [Flagelloscypha sp. PMI_526]|nr:hypothetical protein DL96DRAFT_106148 [Flagelloscypha sp. PMI_526]